MYPWLAGSCGAGSRTYARAVGAEAIQIFASNLRGWAVSPGDPRQNEALRIACAERRVPAFVHAPYLVNFGSPTARTLELSVAATRHALARGSAVGARGVVVHTGSAVAAAHRESALRQVRALLLPLLDAIPEDGPDLLLEPTAGQGESLCATVGQLPPYLAALDDHPRAGVSLDTCHAFAAGHDLAAPGGVGLFLDRLVHEIGPGRLALVHANDAKDTLGSRRDRHENIGYGRIGTDAFAALLRHPAVAGVPVVVETPGERARRRRDVTLLKSLRHPG